MSKVEKIDEILPLLEKAKHPSVEIDRLIEDVFGPLHGCRYEFTSNFHDASLLLPSHLGYTLTKYPGQNPLPEFYSISIPRVGNFHHKNAAIAMCIAALSVIKEK